VIPIVGDVTTSVGASLAVAEVIERLGRIDILVNNLGDSISKPSSRCPAAPRA